MYSNNLFRSKKRLPARNNDPSPEDTLARKTDLPLQKYPNQPAKILKKEELKNKKLFESKIPSINKSQSK